MEDSCARGSGGFFCFGLKNAAAPVQKVKMKGSGITFY